MNRLLHKKSTLLIAAGIVIIAAVLVNSVLISDNEISPQPESITYSTNTPDENKPGKDYAWRGKSSDPKYIKLATIDTEGFIQNVGIDQNNQVAVPNNIHMVGWFSASVRPGETGLSIIDGHVDGRQHDGIFKNLKNIKINNHFSIEFGDGSTKEFTVRKIMEVALADAAGVLFSQDPKIYRQVNLITCGGTFNRQAQTYDKRIIVMAELSH